MQYARHRESEAVVARCSFRSMGAVKPAAGHVTVGILCFGLGGLLCARNFTMEKGTFKFSTDDDHHCLDRLRKTYEKRRNDLQTKSMKWREDIDKPLTDEAEKTILEDTVSHYLAPTSQDGLFGVDIVLYNGKGKPILIDRTEFDFVRRDWTRVLSHFGVRACVDEFRIGEDFSPFSQRAVDEVLKKCRAEIAHRKTK